MHDIACASVVLETEADNKQVASVLRRAFSPVWDQSIIDQPCSVKWRTRWPPRRAVYAVALATRTAAREGVVPSVIGWAVDNAYLAESKRLSSEMAFSDALSNAIIHGNLELTSMRAFAGSPNVEADSADAYFATISERLASRAYGFRPIGITWRCGGKLMFLHVDDVGRGYDPQKPVAHASQDQFSGRGRLLMRALVRHVRISRGGSRLTLGFLRA